ncbi:MAG: hypothetical protein CG440_970, partial [Methanosaeta sp. NSM2]
MRKNCLKGVWLKIDLHIGLKIGDKITCLSIPDHMNSKFI